MRQFTARNLLLLAVLLCSSCSWVSQRIAVTRCNFEWVSLSHEKSNLTHTEFQIELRAQNPNNTAATLDRIVYTFYADDLKIAEGRSQGPITIHAGKTSELPIQLKVSHLSAVGAIARIYKGEVSQYRLIARVYMSTAFGEMGYDIELWRKGI